MSEAMRILIQTTDPEPIAAKVRERHPGAEVTTCDSFDGMAEATRCDPHVVFTDQCEDKPYPRDAVMDGASLGFVHVSGAGVNHLAPWDTAKVDVCNAGGGPGRGDGPVRAGPPDGHELQLLPLSRPAEAP